MYLSTEATKNRNFQLSGFYEILHRARQKGNTNLKRIQKKSVMGYRKTGWRMFEKLVCIGYFEKTPRVNQVTKTKEYYILYIKSTYWLLAEKAV